MLCLLASFFLVHVDLYCIVLRVKTSNMSLLYLKWFKGKKERTELPLDSLEGLTVKDLREIVSEKTGVPLDELTLIYGGRVLKLKNTVSQYKIIHGCTLYITRKHGQSKEPVQESQQNSSFNALIGNRRVLTVIGRVLSNPSLLQAMLAGTPLEGNQALRDTLSDPELLSSLSDPDTIEEYLKENPHMAVMMESVLRVYHLIFGEGAEGGGGTGDGVDEAVEMVEGNLEDDIEEAQQERIRMAQDQMFEHSQALHAHQRHTQAVASSSQVTCPVQESSSANQSTSQAHGSIQVERQDSGSGGTITQGQLASALAEAMSTNNSQQPSPFSSLDVANSGPPSLSAYNNQPSASSHPSVQASNHPGSSEQAGSVTRQESVSNEALQQALATAMSNIPTPSSSQDAENQPRMTLREKYMAQLEQLHIMGIRDDAVCIQALEAAGGDLQSALEIIYSR